MLYNELDYYIDSIRESCNSTQPWSYTHPTGCLCDFCLAVEEGRAPLVVDAAGAAAEEPAREAEGDVQEATSNGMPPRLSSDYMVDETMSARQVYEEWLRVIP